MCVKRYFFLFSLLVISNGWAFGQVPSDLFSRIELRIDTMMFTSRNNLIVYNG